MRLDKSVRTTHDEAVKTRQPDLMSLRTPVLCPQVLATAFVVSLEKTEVHVPPGAGCFLKA